MRKRGFLKGLMPFIILIGLLTMPVVTLTQEAVQDWELLNPEGAVRMEEVKIAPRLKTLEGKTVELRWNGKPNGELFLDRIAELLTEKVKNVKIIKAWEVLPETATISHTPEKGKEFAKKLTALKPDIVIGSSAD